MNALGTFASISASPEPSWHAFLVGSSPAFRQVIELISLIGPRRSTVLIMGETGTGKEGVARAIHLASPRAAQEIIALNCAAIPKDLLEAELFGHVKGAFTSAGTARVGRFEQANLGTLFLDEVGDMPLALQAKLLRVLQEREFQRLGSSETIKVDVRVIAATNVDLLDRVRRGEFREDLYYRLHVVPVRIPPLRARKEDIPLLIEHFVRKICAQEGLPLKEITPEVLTHLAEYTWPGNVRQLENMVEMAVVLSAERQHLTKNDFPLPMEMKDIAFEFTGDQLVKLPEEGLDFEAVIGRIELNLLEQALQRANGNKKVAADILRLKRTTLAAKLKSFETQLPPERTLVYE
jgi:transcriptional regulator with GAF, ATPase, and Fis domain